MATSSRSAERFKYGICLNDECPLCKEKKIQQIPMRKELVCTNPECGKPLRECPPPKTGPNWKKIAATVGAVAGMAAIGGGIYALTGTSEPKEPLKLALNHTQKTLKVGETDTLIVTLTPEGIQATIDWKASNKSNAIVVSSDGIVTAKGEGKSKVQVKAVVGTDAVTAICSYSVTAGNSAETLISELSITESDFSLKVGETKEVHFKTLPEKNDEQVTFESENPAVATVSAGVVKAVKAGTTKLLAKSSKSGKTASVYVTVKGGGDIRNPWEDYATFDGTTMTFKKSHIIPGTNQVANPGDKVTGKWVNGEVNLVRWYHNGTSETLTHK